MLKMLSAFTFGLVMLALPLGTASTASAAERQSADLFQLAAHGDRVCCKRGWRDWWSTRWQCRRAGGYVTRNRECRDHRAHYRRADHRRVCCKRGRSDWWSTYRQCRRAGGYVTYKRACRDDRYDRRRHRRHHDYDRRY